MGCAVSYVVYLGYRVDRAHGQFVAVQCLASHYGVYSYQSIEISAFVLEEIVLLDFGARIYVKPVFA